MSRFFPLLFCFLMTGCATFGDSRQWPADVPDRDYFVQAFQLQDRSHTASARRRHLNWIKRFYRGWAVAPTGWNRMTELLLAGLSSETDRQEATQRLHQLGRRVSVEWAQDHPVRKIDTANVSAWGDGLRKSAELGEQLEFIGVVEKDVDQLLDGELHKSEVRYERYYPAEQVDNF